jgi:hypothetical protein
MRARTSHCGGMSVGPGRIEVHVNGKRAGPPNGDGGEERPGLRDVFAGQTEREKKSEEAVESGGKSHGETVRSGEAVCGNSRAESAGDKDGGMG